MRGRFALAAAGLAALTAGALTAAAVGQGAQELQLAATAKDRGWIDFHVHGRPGTTVSIVEQLGASGVPVADVPLSGADAELPHALRWRCDRLRRVFVASAPDTLGGTETATAELTTASCRNRLGARFAHRARAGRRVRVKLRDRFGVGALPVSLCIRPPGGRRRCGRRRIPAGRRTTTAGFPAPRPGRWQVAAAVRGGRRHHREVRVRPRHGALRVLATGDSMIQILDGFLAQRLPGRARSDARIGSGISKPAVLDWVRHARRQVRREPDVTIVFIGANDGFPIAGVACCGRAWVKRYAARVRAMMATYKRGNAGEVYWLMLPTPRDAMFARVFGPVNRALRRAASSFKRQVRLIDLRRVFTPDRRFHRAIRYGGRRVVVRQDDGVHLSAAGASIAASLVIRALRRDRIL